MGTHATREDEIDELLRGEVFVDLLQVVRQALRAGVAVVLAEGRSSSSFFTRTRRRQLGERGRDRVRALARRRRPGAARRDRGVQRGGLPRDARAARLAARANGRGGGPVRRRDPVPRAAGGARAEGRCRRPHRGRASSATRCSGRRSRATGSELAARLLEYHRREARPAWWWYFRRREMTDDELADDGEALGGLRWDRAEPEPVAQVARVDVHLPAAAAPVRRGRRRRGPASRGNGVDRVGGRQRDRPGSRSAAGSRSATRRCRRLSSPAGRSRQGHSRRRSAGSASRSSPATVATGTSSACSAASRRSAGAAYSAAEIEEQRALLDELDGSYLVVQGPPGSGKTYRGARLDHAPARAGAEGRDHRAEPQGDPQPARRDRGGGRRGADLDFKGIKHGDALRERARQAERRRRSWTRPGRDARRRHGLAVRARGARRRARHARRRRGRPVLASPTRSPAAPPPGGSSCSATRSSSPR